MHIPRRIDKRPKLAQNRVYQWFIWVICVQANSAYFFNIIDACAMLDHQLSNGLHRMALPLRGEKFFLNHSKRL
jgi:hypothetical protein